MLPPATEAALIARLSPGEWATVRSFSENGDVRPDEIMHILIKLQVSDASALLLLLRKLGMMTLSTPSPYRLTARELELIAALLRGSTNKDIAKALGISVETVKRHMANIMDKTGMGTRTEIAVFALDHKLVTR
jgi:DNA-binding NarL/FixJ family response regulator